MKREYVKLHLDSMREILDKIENTGDLFYMRELVRYAEAFQEALDNDDYSKIEDWRQHEQHQ